MKTRRDFLKQAVLGCLSVAAALPRAAASSSSRRLYFAQAVRDRTKKLVIPPDRWRWIIAHHSGTKYGNAAIYDREHRARGMENGLAYHFVIGNGVDSKDGQIEIGRRWLKQLKGGHVRSEEINQSGIGICLVGNFEISNPTRKQVLAFQELVDYLRGEPFGRKLRFAAHREIDPGHTACPGHHFPLADMHRQYGGNARVA